MSLWFRRKDKRGRTHWYGVEILPLLFLFLITLAGLLALALASFVSGP